jgi:CubicO group peptidase (beta-lactamase class C family)
MSWYINREMKKKKTVGLSIALVDGERIVWQQGFGYADKKNKIKATPETIFRAGSISKVFNAMATMKLVEQGKLDIDRPLTDYLPEFQIKTRFGSTDDITPRTIMTHHSGLPGDWVDGMWSKNPQSFTRLVHLIKDEYTAYPPNTILSYSNLGVTLLGHALENTSKTPYANFIDQVLLQPMGMNSSQFQPEISGEQTSKSYQKGKPVTEYPLRDIPAGGLNTSATDLSQLGVLINNHGKINGREVISEKSINEMLTVQNADIPLDTGQQIGLGWFILDKILKGEEPVYGHDGGTIAHRSSFMVAPRSGLAITVLSNSNNCDSNTIASKALQLAWSTKTGKQLPTGSETTTKVLEPSDFEGIYATLLGKTKIEEHSDRHFSIETAGSHFNLRHQEGGKYFLKYRLLGLLPLKVPDLSEIAFHTEEISDHHVIIGKFSTERFLAGVRVQLSPITVAWKRRLGHYNIINQPEPEIFQTKNAELKIEDDFLVLSSTDESGQSISSILRVVNDNEAIVEGLGRGMGETIRVISDDLTGTIFIHSGVRAKLDSGSQ